MPFDDVTLSPYSCYREDRRILFKRSSLQICIRFRYIKCNLDSIASLVSINCSHLVTEQNLTLWYCYTPSLSCFNILCMLSIYWYPFPDLVSFWVTCITMLVLKIYLVWNYSGCVCVREFYLSTISIDSLFRKYAYNRRHKQWSETELIGPWDIWLQNLRHDFQTPFKYFKCSYIEPFLWTSIQPHFLGPCWFWVNTRPGYVLILSSNSLWLHGIFYKLSNPNQLYVPWCMPGSLTLGGVENVPGIPGAGATQISRIGIFGEWIFCNLTKISLKYVSKDPINNNHNPALV